LREVAFRDSTRYNDQTNREETDMQTQALDDVAAQALWQAREYGEWNEKMPDGTGPDVRWLEPVAGQAVSEAMYADLTLADRPMPFTAAKIEALLRTEWDFPKDGTPEQQEAAAEACSWMRILREEVAEAFAAADPERLRAELIQIAAVAVNWADTISRRPS
jgi:hypothetical protein